MSDQEVAEHYDAAAQHSSGGIAFWRDELARRHSERQTRVMVRLTWTITAMTAVILFATIINVVLFALAP